MSDDKKVSDVTLPDDSFVDTWKKIADSWALTLPKDFTIDWNEPKYRRIGNLESITIGKPKECIHDFEEKMLFTSSYKVCKHCGEEQ